MSRTAPQNPNNMFTPNAITVATSTGFNQGDLVYQSNTGNFGRIPDNAISSDTFNITQNSPLMPTPVNGGVVLAANTTGSSYGECAATLTNGNIVNVYVAQSASNNVAFKITDVNNTIVVAETVVSTIFQTGYSNPSVAALSGGGFVVTWINTSAGGTLNSICYAVYTNAGAVTFAAAQDTTLGTFSTIGYPVYALGLPNGNFVLASPNSSVQMAYRIYNANGTPAYAASVNPGTNGYNLGTIVGLAARSDSSVLFVGRNGATVYYFIISATNTAITNSSFTSTFVSNGMQGVTATCLSDGTTFVIGYYGSTLTTTNSSAFRFLPTGNTLSSETFFTNGISSTSTTYNFGGIAIQALASGNFMLLVSEYGGLSNYAVFNSSGVCISGASAGTPIPKRLWASITRSGGQLTTIILTSTSINVYWTVANNNYGSPNVFGLVQSFVRLSLSTYDPIPVIGSTTTVATATAGVNGYNIGTATPTSAKFTASSTLLATSTQPMAFVRNETTIASYACWGVHSATLTNGNFVVVYSNNNSPYAVSASIYTSAGTLVTSFIVSSSAAGTNANVRVAALSGGNFAVVYATGASSPFALTAAVYTASGSLVGTSTVATSSQLDNSSYGFSVSGITNNRFVVAYAASSGNVILYRVLDSSCVSLAVGNTGYAGFKVSVAGYPAGGFAICFWDGTTQTIAKLNETSTNVFSAAASYNFNTNSTSNAISYAKVAVNSDNMATMMTMQSNAIWNSVVPYEVSSNAVYSPVSFRQVSTSIPSGYNNFTSCFTAYGSIVTVCTDSTAAFNTLPAGWNVNTANITTNFGLSAGNYVNTSAGSDINLIPLYGNVVLFVYKDTSYVPKFVIFNATPYTATQQITAGVTSSNGVAISQPFGFSLAGVAASTATAGGTGLIQTNGIATLNSSYNASTPAQNFDFQNNTGVGVKGTIAGRNVTLQGNI